MDGLICGTCLVAVLEHLHELDGVVEVAIRLNVAGGSPAVVVSDERLSPSTLAGAVAAAGFAVTAHSFDDRPARDGAPAVRDPRSNGDQT
ncbi:hypothetical protein [Actinotalea sp.]|uniref:hypothetical protein n=1 Tax=Actinotalea sp. TaxID=1872145 RepID=UPI003569404D